MLEFLSSIKLDQLAGTLAFTLHNQIHQIHVDTICDIVGALKERYTYSEKGKKNGYFHQDCKEFWCKLSKESTYNSNNAKSSSIIHPVLKDTHRIITYLLFPQEDISKASKK